MTKGSGCVLSKVRNVWTSPLKNLRTRGIVYSNRQKICKYVRTKVMGEQTNDYLPKKLQNKFASKN